MQRHTISGEKTRIASTEKEKKANEVQRYTISGRKSCIVTRGRTRRRATVQRHTISQGKPCIASIRKEKKEDAMQRYTIPRRKTCVASTGRGKKQTESTPQRTTRYDHTTHHNRTTQNIHIHTRQHYQHTKPHTIPQTPYATPHTTKALPQKRRKSFIEIYQGQLGLEPTGVSNEPETRPYWIPEPTGGQNQLLHRSNYIVPDQPDPSTKYFKGPTGFKLQTVP